MTTPIEPNPQPRGAWFYFGVFVLSVVAAALVVTQGLLYGLRDLPVVARDVGFFSFAAWLVAALWSLWATAERRAPKPWRSGSVEASAWCVVPAVLGLALYLVAAGDAVIFPPHGGDDHGQGVVDKDTVAIRWAAEDGVSSESPENSEIKESNARAAFSVVDPSDPGCARISYSWSIRRTDGPGDTSRIDGTSACSAIAPELVKNASYRVSVAGVRAGGEAVTGEQDFHLREFVILSLGDSVASGEGNKGPSPEAWRDAACHRSAFAGPRRAARLLQRVDRHVIVAFVHLACTGAWIDGGSDPPKFVKNHPAVLRSLRPERQIGTEEVALAGELPRAQTPDLVFLSVGANDIGFGPIIAHCFIWPRCPRRHIPAVRGPTLAKIVSARLATLAGSFHRLAGNPYFRDPSRVFVTEYFDPLRGRDGKFCPKIPSPVSVGRLGALGPDEIRWAERDVLRSLNVAVRRASHAAGWNYVGRIRAAFRRHGICAGNQSWIVPLPRLLNVFDEEDRMGAFHPNLRGQKLYGRRIAAAVLAAHMFPRSEGG